MRRDATRFYQRPGKLPMFFNVSEHTIGVTPCDATRCDAMRRVKILESLGGPFYRARHTAAFRCNGFLLSIKLCFVLFNVSQQTTLLGRSMHFSDFFIAMNLDLIYDVVMTMTQIKSHCNALGVCTQILTHQVCS